MKRDWATEWCIAVVMAVERCTTFVMKNYPEIFESTQGEDFDNLGAWRYIEVTRKSYFRVLYTDRQQTSPRTGAENLRCLHYVHRLAKVNQLRPACDCSKFIRAMFSKLSAARRGQSASQTTGNKLHVPYSDFREVFFVLDNSNMRCIKPTSPSLEYWQIWNLSDQLGFLRSVEMTNIL